MKVSPLGATLPPVNTLHENLPLRLSSFVGRIRELPEVKQLLATARLVTLTGAGGCGKTSLALHTCREVRDTYVEGVCWVELAPVTDPDLVPQAVMNALGITEQPGRSLAETVVDYLRDKHLLLVLDNCEHLIAACAQFATLLLAHCLDLRVLATSREALNVEGEHIWIVSSLKFPARDALLSTEKL